MKTLLQFSDNRALTGWEVIDGTDCPDPGPEPLAVPLRLESGPPDVIQRVHRILYPLRRRKLRRIIREWLPLAIRNGPRSVEWEFVANWSFELRCTFGE
jgi:hypothetical protein